jgi:hypothetical protein
METFLQLNRDKLKPTFGRLSLILVGFVSVVLFIAYLTDNFPTVQLIGSIILVTAIGFPLFIMLLGYIGWHINHKVRQKAFSKVPFSDIENIGFYKAYSGDNSKWTFTHEIKKGHINGFTLTMDVSKEKGHTLEFDIPTEWKKLDKNHFSRLTEKFKQHNIEFKMGSLVKQYDTRQPEMQTVAELKQDLELTTTILLHEGFEPKN